MDKFVRRLFLLLVALAMTLVSVSAAYAESEWQIFDTISDVTGPDAAKNGNLVMQRDLYHGVVNGVEIAVTEAGYDGLTLFLRIAYRKPGVESVGGNPEEEAINTWSAGWWYDQFWIDGKGVNIAAGTRQDWSRANFPGELIETDIRPLASEGVTLSGKVSISLPIGKKPASLNCTRDESPEMFDETGLLQPDEGVVTFELDTKDIASMVRVFRPEKETDLSGFSAKVEEADFSPLMTYIFLDLSIKPGAFEAFIAENGKSLTDENGEVMWEYTSNDLFSSWLADLRLVDGNGTLLFSPEDNFEYENDTEKAEFIFPYIDVLPESLYLAPYDYETEQVDMSRAVQVI